ncbi:ABC transporter ATP-binding protein [Bifidobacterium samirii]|uniref:ABC transporter permease n=1 Tax=Bifidobacterium samirii TaxID=2306974 RepID=A0A430FWG0_9BIFI|nr:ABC transporter ATP-binding protein [Bifidobacterium samirii]RSX58707.1 ABC transporter permease [Bifidobacterium samirii]
MDDNDGNNQMQSSDAHAPERPRYGMWRNSAFMVRLAWCNARVVPFIVVAMALAAAGRSITELYVGPTVLNRIETHASPVLLLATIGVFTATLTVFAAVRAYFDVCSETGRIATRIALLRLINGKSASTAYANTLDTRFRASEEQSAQACNSNWTATERIWDTWTVLLTDIVGFVAYLSVLSGLDPRLIALILATSLAAYLPGKRINEWGFRHRRELQARRKRLGYLYTLGDEPRYAKDIRIFGLSGWIGELRDGAVRAMASFLHRRERIHLWANVIDVALAFARNGIAYAYLLHLTLDQGLSASRFLLYATAVSGFTTWVTDILDRFGELNRQSLEISAIREFLEWPEPAGMEGGEALHAIPGHEYAIAFDHVSYRYPGADHDSVHDIDLTIQPGESIAIVGLNGAGKTTLVKLACGLLDPTEGRVLLDGIDIRRYARRDYYELFATVFQDFSVLDTTIAQNVAQRIDGIDTRRVIDCLDQAGLGDTVRSLPDGADTHLGRSIYEDGIELSGGQTQRLMLARALYRNAPILLLDEPTAALDPIAEDDIYRHYQAMTDGRTSMFISHRLASTRFCERILVMDDGRITEEGTHDSLLAANGAYARLFDVQSRYYRHDA